MELLEFSVNGQIDVSIPIELPSGKKELKALCKKLMIDPKSSNEDIAKTIVLEAIRAGLDMMDYRSSEGSDVSDYSLEVEES